jgi:hypothetical protein
MQRMRKRSFGMCRQSNAPSLVSPHPLEAADGGGGVIDRHAQALARAHRHHEVLIEVELLVTLGTTRTNQEATIQVPGKLRKRSRMMQM